jgi:hypothetical protein
MLKAWEAMRLGKDAQITGLLERCKRHEEVCHELTFGCKHTNRKHTHTRTHTQTHKANLSCMPMA